MLGQRHPERVSILSGGKDAVDRGREPFRTLEERIVADLVEDQEVSGQVDRRFEQLLVTIFVPSANDRNIAEALNCSAEIERFAKRRVDREINRRGDLHWRQLSRRCGDIVVLKGREGVGTLGTGRDHFSQPLEHFRRDALGNGGSRLGVAGSVERHRTDQQGLRRCEFGASIQRRCRDEGAPRKGSDSERLRREGIENCRGMGKGRIGRHRCLTGGRPAASQLIEEHQSTPRKKRFEAAQQRLVIESGAGVKHHQSRTFAGYANKGGAFGSFNESLKRCQQFRPLNPYPVWIG